jgi:hypothetical protein
MIGTESVVAMVATEWLRWAVMVRGGRFGQFGLMRLMLFEEQRKSVRGRFRVAQDDQIYTRDLITVPGNAG